MEDKKNLNNNIQTSNLPYHGPAGYLFITGEVMYAKEEKQ